MKNLLLMLTLFSCSHSGQNREVASGEEHLDASENIPLRIARCAQDIVDYRHGEVAGLEFAGTVLTNLLRQNESKKNQLLELDTSCTNYLENNQSTDISRAEHLEALQKLKSGLDKKVYFFLRGVIRPLISCERKSDEHRKNLCLSTTGKRWLELRVKERGEELTQYRLGHSDGLRVNGPQDYFDNEDRLFIQSLPKDFAGSAISDLPATLQLNFKAVRYWSLPGTNRFIEHFFPITQ